MKIQIPLANHAPGTGALLIHTTSYASQFTQFTRELLNWRLRNLATSHCKLIHTCNSHIICIRMYSIPERIAAWGAEKYSNFQLQTNPH
jgi:hypothetical protein